MLRVLVCQVEVVAGVRVGEKGEGGCANGCGGRRQRIYSLNATRGEIYVIIRSHSTIQVVCSHTVSCVVPTRFCILTKENINIREVSVRLVF